MTSSSITYSGSSYRFEFEVDRWIVRIEYCIYVHINNIHRYVRNYVKTQGALYIFVLFFYSNGRKTNRV